MTRLPVVAPNTERLRKDASNFMQHSTDDRCRLMCRIAVDDLAVLLAWVAQFPVAERLAAQPDTPTPRNEGSQSRSHPMTFSISKTRELCDAATEGPWTATDNSWESSSVYGPDDAYIAEYPIAPEVDEDTQTKFEAIKEANAAFIAHARTALPQALDEIERLTRERDEAVGLARQALRNLNAFSGPDPKALIDAARDDLNAFLSRHKEG